MASYGKSTGKSVAIVFLVVLLAAAIFFGVVTEGFTNWDASTWFGKDQEQGTVVDGDGNEMEDGGSYQLPKAIVYTAGARGAAPATSVQVTAVLEPADAMNQKVTWEIVFADPASEWANGKNVSDYVSIEETESLTNTVTFKQAFGEQILITVTSQENAEAKDTCTVDCAAKLESTYVTFAAASGVSGDVAVELNATSGTSSAWAMFKYFDTEEIKAAQLTHNTTDVYTIEDSYTTIVTIAPSAELLAKAKEINSSAVSGSVDITSGFAPNMDFFAQLLGESFANKTNLYELGRVLDAKGVANPFVVTVTTTSTYTADVTDTYYMAYTASNFGKAVTGIHFDDDTIIF